MNSTNCKHCLLGFERMVLRMQAEVLHEVLSGTMDNDAAGGHSTKVMRYMSRLDLVNAQFPHSMFMDDFLMRVEMALGVHGFRGDNSLALVNLCREEATGILKQRIEFIFGSTFNTNGLGACLTCGRLGAILPIFCQSKCMLWQTVTAVSVDAHNRSLPEA
jgi:hypothetical protein